MSSQPQETASSSASPSDQSARRPTRGPAKRKINQISTNAPGGYGVQPPSDVPASSPATDDSRVQESPAKSAALAVTPKSRANSRSRASKRGRRAAGNVSGRAGPSNGAGDETEQTEKRPRFNAWEAATSETGRFTPEWLPPPATTLREPRVPGKVESRATYATYSEKIRGAGRGALPSRLSRASSPSGTVINATTRGKGGRVKKSTNPRIQALYIRRSYLRHHYKTVASYQKQALEVLANKSLVILKMDPRKHEQLPEFDATIGRLGEIFQKITDRHDHLIRYQKKLVEERRRQDRYLAARMKENEAEDEDEFAMVKLLERINKASHVLPASTKYFIPPIDHQARINQPVTKTLAAVGALRFPAGEWPAIVGDHVSIEGDTATEQNPYNFHRNLGPEDRKKSEAALKRRRQPPAHGGHYFDDIDNFWRAPKDSYTEEVRSRERTRQEQPDEYGAWVPNGAALVNRDKKILTKFPQIPNERREDLMYLEGAERIWHSTTDERLKSPGELDPRLVELFKLHPKWGIITPFSVNPDFEIPTSDVRSEPKVGAHPPGIGPRSDWTKPLAPTAPLIFDQAGEVITATIAEPILSRPGIFLTSRSEHFLRQRQIFEELDARARVEALLAAKEELEIFQQMPPPSRLSTPAPMVKSPIKLVPQVIDQDLLGAADEAWKDFLQESAAALERVETLHAVAESPRGNAYDPIRNILHQRSAPIAVAHHPPPAYVTRLDTSRLSVLADITTAQAPAFTPVLIPAQIQIQRPFPAPVPAPIPNPVSALPLTPATPGAGSGFRAILPAPPGPSHNYRY